MLSMIHFIFSLSISQVYLDKTKLDVDALIGQPYGSTFEVDRGKLVKIEGPAASELSLGETCKSILFFLFVM